MFNEREMLLKCKIYFKNIYVVPIIVQNNYQSLNWVMLSTPVHLKSEIKKMCVFACNYTVVKLGHRHLKRKKDWCHVLRYPPEQKIHLKPEQKRGEINT